jgi:hypothetical protein
LKKKTNKPLEGQIYALRLDDGRYALGVLARVEWSKPRKPYGVFVYFFGPYVRIPDIKEQMNELSPERCVARLLTSALDIYSGEWSLVGTVTNWSRYEWELPNFLHTQWSSGETFSISLDEADLTRILKMERLTGEQELQEHISYGSEAARKLVSEKCSLFPSVH